MNAAPASLTSSSSSSASSSSASSSTSGHNGSASGGTQTPETDMIEMEDMMESGEREPLLGGKREQMGAAGAHATSSVTIEADGAAASARAGDPIQFPYLHTPYNPHQQGYGSAGSSTPPPSSASAASSVSPPPPAVNERDEREREREERAQGKKGELDSSRRGEETNSLTCAAVNEYVRQDTKAAAMVPERPFTSTNRDYSNFLTNQTIGPTMYPSFAGPRFIGGPGTATPAAEPESGNCAK